MHLEDTEGGGCFRQSAEAHERSLLRRKNKVGIIAIFIYSDNLLLAADKAEVTSGSSKPCLSVSPSLRLNVTVLTG
jgi:hypothetical protein